jgi:two-component system, NtrC family, response regulator GlrR
MRKGTSIWVVEEGAGLATCIESECPGLAVTVVHRDSIAVSGVAPNLAVVDASERPAACSSIREMRRHHPAVRVLIVAPGSSAEPLPADFDDFVFSPFQPGELRLRLERLSENGGESASVPREDESLREIRDRCRLDAVIGESPQLLEAIRKVPRLGASGANVLITGDTGTGKELFARAIHYASARHDQPFVPVNCSALPDALLENELFGHEKGAYTGAYSAGVGLLAIAERGSLFLDEVDSLSPASQAKLLRVLQDREYRPLGSRRACKANVRIIAAANGPLPQRVAAREFRADLYYRLNVLALRLPPMSERTGDLPILARHFVARFAKECQRPAPTISPEAMRRLMNYGWPGNVRELESAVQRAVVLSDDPVLHATCFELPDSWGSPSAAPNPSSLPIAAAVHQFERQYLAGVLSSQNGNVTRAAQAAGKDRRSFQRLLRRHGIVNDRIAG